MQLNGILETSFDFTPQQAELIADRIVERLQPKLIRPQGLLTAQELSDFLGVSLSTVERMTADGDLPSYKIGRGRRYNANEVLASLRIDKKSLVDEEENRTPTN